MLNLPVFCYSSWGSHGTIFLLSAYPTQILVEWTPAMNPQPWLFNRLWHLCSALPLFILKREKKFLFLPDDSISYISADQQDCNTFTDMEEDLALEIISLKWTEQPLRWGSTYKIKPSTCTLKQENEPTLGCPTSIWDAVVSTASLPSAQCQCVELLLCLLSLLPVSRFLALSPACSRAEFLCSLCFLKPLQCCLSRSSLSLRAPSTTLVLTTGYCN